MIIIVQVGSADTAESDLDADVPLAERLLGGIFDPNILRRMGDDSAH
jgi:hypothetical protein